MKLGTPGFVGERLREARESRGITATALAELLGVSRQAVSQYETGSARPHPSVLEQFATILNFPVQFFLRPPIARSEESVFYRSMSSATKSARTRAETRIGWIEEILWFLDEHVELPRVNVPDLGLGDDPLQMSMAEIESAAHQLRRLWGVGDGPISNLVRLMEANGIIVTRLALEAETLDAFSTWVGERPMTFLGKDKGSAVRSRFDGGHEIGHHVLHRKVAAKLLHRGVDFKQLENQAHRFASALLLPAESFCREVYAPTLDTFLRLKPRWGVSVGMMIKRAETLNLVSEDQARYLWINYTRRGWRSWEPMDDELETESPSVLRASFDLLVGHGVMSREAILSKLPFAPRDLEELSSLPSGFFNEPDPNVTYLPSLRSNTGRSGAGSVVPFPGNRSSN